MICILLLLGETSFCAGLLIIPVLDLRDADELQELEVESWGVLLSTFTSSHVCDLKL